MARICLLRIPALVPLVISANAAGAAVVSEVVAGDGCAVGPADQDAVVEREVIDDRCDVAGPAGGCCGTRSAACRTGRGRGSPAR